MSIGYKVAFCLQAELEERLEELQAENEALRGVASRNSVMLAESRRYNHLYAKVLWE